MSATELIVEKAKNLTEDEAQAVLNYMEHLPGSRRWTARELLLLPRAQRDYILARQFAQAAELYRDNPELVVEVVDPPMDYE